MVNNRSYFNTHGHLHIYHKDPSFYQAVVANIGKTKSPLTVLDLGCGDASFIDNIMHEDIKGDFFGIDVSSSMLQEASKRFEGDNVNLIVADGFALPLVQTLKFDLVHLDSVLHHIVGRSRSQSRDLSSALLRALFNRTAGNGSILVEEMFYKSYLIPSFTSAIIFHSLKIINFLRLDFGFLVKDIIPGLEVNFYSESELIQILEQFGEVQVVKKTESRPSKLQRLFLQKAFGHISIIVRKGKFSSKMAAQVGET